MNDTRSRKDLGAFYTPPVIADFLVKWAIRSSSDLILDPSFGDGVFIDSALRILHPTSSSHSQVYGIEYDESAFERTMQRLGGKIQQSNFVLDDFFNLRAMSSQQLLVDVDYGLPRFDAVVGNPPFIRYQRFKGKMRKKSQERAKEQGVELNGLSSSWASFVVHAIAFLKESGRLAMVMPAEIMHASYAVPVVNHLKTSFASVKIIAFRKKIFASLSQDTVLVLCDQKGAEFESLRIIDIESTDELRKSVPDGEKVDVELLLNGNTRMIEYLLPKPMRVLYGTLKENPDLMRFGKIADVGIGYVTGDNEYFHLSQHDITRFGIPKSYLSRSVRTGRQLGGLFFTSQEFEEIIEGGGKNYLLDLRNHDQSKFPEPIRRYIHLGESKGVHTGFKCRSRTPWYVVPHIYDCDGFLTYMSGQHAKFVINCANAFAPNTLHIVRLRKRLQDNITELAVTWLTSLTMLSTEIEGHSMGGGMLKLEPREAQKTLVAMPKLSKTMLNSYSSRIDSYLRKGQWKQANQLADEIILGQGLGLSSNDIFLLHNGAEQLRNRRYNR